jgi:hypothetical protein
MEIPATGAPVDARFVIIWEDRDRKVTRGWYYYDRLRTFEQQCLAVSAKHFAALQTASENNSVGP